MESLNLDELDLEGLERRLELAAMAATPVCSNDCCTGNCNGDLSWKC
jgi:hypothetical protein